MTGREEGVREREREVVGELGEGWRGRLLGFGDVL